MTLATDDLCPVAILLDQVDVGADVRLSGIDAKSGARISVLIEHMLPATDRPSSIYDASGLVLLLTIEAL